MLEGRVFFEVVNRLGFFKVDYQSFLALVKGTRYSVEVQPGKLIGFEVTEGKVEVVRDVKVKIEQDQKEVTGIKAADLIDADGKRSVSYGLDVDEYLKVFKTYEETEGYYRQQLSEDLKSGDYERIQRARNNLGHILIVLGKYGEASHYFRQNLKAAHKEQDERWDPASYNNLGEANRGLGKYRKAIEHYEKALAILLKVYPDGKHPYVAAAYNNLGLVYSGLGDYRRAIEYLNKALAIHLTVFPDGVHNDIAASYINLGGAYVGTGEYRKAIRYLEKVLDIQEERFKPDPTEVALQPSMAQVYGTLSYAQLLDRHPKDAIASALRGLEFDPSQIWIKVNLAHVYLFDNQFEKAQAIYLENKDLKVNESQTFCGICSGRL